LTAAAGANPIEARMISRAWFNAEDEFLVLFDLDGGNGYLDQIPDLVFSTSQGFWTFPAGFQAPTSLPWPANLSQLIPGFSINRNQDFFRAQYQSYLDEQFSWGPQNDLSVNLHPLTDGQTAVQTWLWDWDYNVWNIWAKDIGFNSQDPYIPAVNCTLSIHAQNAAGLPAAGVPVYISWFNGPNHTTTAVATDADGNWQYSCYAARVWLSVKDPLTEQFVAEELLFPEPGEFYGISVTVSGTAASDPVLIPAAGTLKLSPNVLSGGKRLLNVKYEAGANPARTRNCASTTCAAGCWNALLCPPPARWHGTYRGWPPASISSALRETAKPWLRAGSP
ncbi:MAG TPA: hypothetical protein PKH19_06525, partial [Candidatus Syntrophosphaera sp.]|nr:hypothetical protein [Candidatus Syntrophosphaera sp.]